MAVVSRGESLLALAVVQTKLVEAMDDDALGRASDSLLALAQDEDSAEADLYRKTARALTEYAVMRREEAGS